MTDAQLEEEEQLKDMGTEGVLSAEECRFIAKHSGATHEHYMDPVWVKDFQARQVYALSKMEKDMKKHVAARDRNMTSQSSKRIDRLRTLRGSSKQLKKGNRDSNFPHNDKWMPIEYNDNWELFKQDFVNDFYYRRICPSLDPRKTCVDALCDLHLAVDGMARQFSTSWTAPGYSLNTVLFPEKKPFKRPTR